MSRSVEIPEELLMTLAAYRSRTRPRPWELRALWARLQAWMPGLDRLPGTAGVVPSSAWAWWAGWWTSGLVVTGAAGALLLATPPLGVPSASSSPSAAGAVAGPAGGAAHTEGVRAETLDPRAPEDAAGAGSEPTAIVRLRAAARRCGMAGELAVRLDRLGRILSVSGEGGRGLECVWASVQDARLGGAIDLRAGGLEAGDRWLELRLE